MKVKVCILMPAELYRSLEAEAAEARMTFEEYIALLLDRRGK